MLIPVEAAGDTVVINQPMVRRSKKYTSFEMLLKTCDLHLQGTTADYGFPWFVRTNWQIELGEIGAIAALAKDPKFPISDLGVVIPDQNGWTCALSEVMPTIGQFVTKAGYTGPVHLITMYMCPFGHADMLKNSAATLLHHIAQLITARKNFEDHTGISPSPANWVGLVIV